MGIYSSGVGNSNNNKVQQQATIIIFDWDDTICPSSFVDRHGLENIQDLPPHFQKLFFEIEKLAEKVLYEASKYGEVLIITNSDDGWVKYSCDRFFPKLAKNLHRYNIVSSRTRYEKFYPGQPLCWKAAAFAHEVNEYYETFSSDLKSGNAETQSDVDTSVPSIASTDISTASDESLNKSVSVQQQNLQKQVISFGDSMEERTAVRIVAEQLGAKPKSVMFVSLPSPLEIIGQLYMLCNHMKYVCNNEKCLDLEISNDQASKSAETFLKKSKIVNSQQEISQLKTLSLSPLSESSSDESDSDAVMEAEALG